MKRSQTFYKLVAGVVILYIVYALVVNLVVDPSADSFLSHKTNLERELKLGIWLKVMHVHVGFACVAMAAGVINLTRSGEKHRRFHRLNGYLYVLSVLVVVLTSGYMAPYATGGKVSGMGFNLINVVWLILTTTALVHIYRKRMVQHRRWMLRSYAFCFTNMLIHLFTFVLHRLFDMAYVTSYIFGLYGSLALILLTPEVLIRVRKLGVEER